ncbi:MAG TPA: hypothetical protein VKF79_07580 [Candidatus Acidoferrum sp.]|nr:hypothetical protein [Candidatus Acidoferrum sp.]
MVVLASIADYTFRVRVSEAKDFLVQQTTEQAQLDGLPLSEVEKRMMYFTEGGEAPENVTELLVEFEADYDPATYEAKISKLLSHAYARVKKHDPESARFWYESIRQLRKGDHYILVMWDQQSLIARPPFDSIKLLGSALGVALLMLGFFVLSDHYGIHWNRGVSNRTSMPLWAQRLLIGLLACTYMYSVVLPWILNKPLEEVTQSLLRFLRAGSKDRKLGRPGNFS